MNDRIKQLAKQHFLHDIRTENGWEEYPHYEFDEDELQSFVEVIVKECGVALSPMLRDMISRGQAHDLIKQHFGVDE